MEMNNKSCGSCTKTRCVTSWIVWILVLVGGINWGLVGIGMFAGGDWNIVHLIFGGAMWLEAIIYILVGVAAGMSVFGGCRCKKCKGCSCCGGSCSPKHDKSDSESDMKMGGQDTMGQM